MRVAVIGGGFTGLSSSFYLLDKGHTPVIFEAGKQCGGLAKGFNPGDWKWDLEVFYHHIFTNDKEIMDLAEKVGWPVQIKEPETTSYIKDQEIKLDSPLSLLRFSAIKPLSRIHMGFGLLLLKLIPNGLFLEKYKVTEYLPKLIGKEGYKNIWEKLLRAKFGPYINEVNMAWFWSRVAKRTKNLGYFEGGFDRLIQETERVIKEKGGDIRTSTPVSSLKTGENETWVNGEKFDAVIITIPAPKAKELLSEVKIPELNYLWGQTLILELSRKFIQGYWMNILEDNFPFVVAVEQTNMVDKKHYGNKRIIYLGNYLPEGHKQLKMSKEQLLKLYLPYLKRINKHISKKTIKRSFLFREPFAQPVFPTNYSKQLPKMRVRARVYLANMSMVYPFDRGTNYAVKAGKEVAEMVANDLR